MTLAMRSISAARALFALVFFVLAGCTIQLSPDYDKTLVAGINEANEQAMTLFSKVKNGANAVSYPKYEEDYDKLLGKLGSLQIQADARGVPPLSQKGWEELSRYEGFLKICPTAAACVNPSVDAIGKAMADIEKMKSRHESNGLTATLVPAFQTPYLAFMQPTLRFETYLGEL